MPFNRLIARITVVALAVVAVGALAAPARAADRSPNPVVRSAPHAAPSTCRGVSATDIVQPGDDFDGTDADEVIVVLGSNADVQAEGGNDTVCVHGSHTDVHQFSTIDGGPGNDVILAVSGAMVAYGDDGNDVILGNGTEMWIYGGNGSDTINVGGATWSTIDAGDWNDRVTGSPGFDTIVGGQGDDGLYGWDGNDDIDGGDGNDLLVGGRGFDTLDGGTDDGWGADLDKCHDYANSATHGASITNCTPQLTPLVADDLQFG